jgi:hypothetical protein
MPNAAEASRPLQCAEKLHEISFLFLLLLFLHSTYKLEIFKLSLGVHDLEHRTVNSKRGLLVMRDIGKADIECYGSATTSHSRSRATALFDEAAC